MGTDEAEADDNDDHDDDDDGDEDGKISNGCTKGFPGTWSHVAGSTLANWEQPLLLPDTTWSKYRNIRKHTFPWTHVSNAMNAMHALCNELGKTLHKKIPLCTHWHTLAHPGTKTTVVTQRST